MNWFRGAGVCAVGIVWLAIGVGCACAADGDEKPCKAETVVIPIDQIWALDMPGTRDVHTLDLGRLPQPLGNLTSGPSSFLPADKPKIAGSGFAVLGIGMDALLAAHAKLPKGQEPRKVFPPGSDVSVVFFSHGFNYYVHIYRIERQGNVFTIRYRFVPHETKNLSSHIALIPVGKLPVGEFRVQIARSPMEKKYLDMNFKPVSSDWERRVVCKSFGFSVTESK